MARAFDEIASRGGADLVVFPELINQGYVKPSTDDDYNEFALAYRRCAELVPGPFTGAVGEMAKAHDCYVVAGMAEAHPAVTGSLYNSCVLIDPQGRVIDVHRKSHIPGHEKFYFYPGTHPLRHRDRRRQARHDDLRRLLLPRARPRPSP